MVPGARTDMEGLDRQRLLAQAFEKAVEARSADVGEFTVEESDGGFNITATIITFEDDEFTSKEMAVIQGELSQMVEAPVAIQATFLLGRRAEFEAVGLPTPTTDP